MKLFFPHNPENHLLLICTPYRIASNLCISKYCSLSTPIPPIPYKTLYRLSDVTYEPLSQHGSTSHVQRNHLIPYYPKELFLHPHSRIFIHFSNSTQFNIPKPNKLANSDFSSFTSDESLFDEGSSQKRNIPPTTSSYDFKTHSSLNDSSPIKLPDNSLFQTIIKTHQTDIPSDRLRHPSQKQSNLPPLPHYNLRHQPKWIIDFSNHRQNFKTKHSLYWLNENWSRKNDKI